MPTAVPFESTLPTPIPTPVPSDAAETITPEPAAAGDEQIPPDGYSQDGEFATPAPTPAPTATPVKKIFADNQTNQSNETDAIPTPYLQAKQGRGLLEGVLDFFSGIFSSIIRLASF